MKNRKLNTVLSLVGALIMILAFLVFPDDIAWYWENALYSFGLLLFLLAKKGKVPGVASSSSLTDKKQ